MRMLSLFLVCLLGFSGACAEPPELEVGQVWSYNEPPTENSQIIIRRIEPLGDDISVHVSISPVPLRRTSDGKLVGGVIAHLPFEYETLRSALIELEDSTDEESELFLEGYLQWKEAAVSYTHLTLPTTPYV